MKKVTFITVQAPWTHTYLQQDLVGVPNEAFEGQISECVSYLNFYRADLWILQVHIPDVYGHICRKTIFVEDFRVTVLLNSFSFHAFAPKAHIWKT